MPPRKPTTTPGQSLRLGPETCELVTKLQAHLKQELGVRISRSDVLRLAIKQFAAARLPKEEQS